VGYPTRFAEGSPFFLSDKKQPGSVVYDRVSYRGVNLLFDELRGAVIFQDESHQIQLSGDRISRFAIGDHTFIRIFHDSLGTASPETGFYQVLYEGKLRVLKKEIKTVRETNSFGQEIIHVIDTKTNYYLQHDSKYTQINSQKELLDFYSRQKKEVLHFIKKNKLNFKKDPDDLLIQVAAYYEHQ
jgi:hypothetical protein